MGNTPNIRFKGFTDDWEQRKFGELYEKVNEKNNLSFGVDKIISVANMYFKEDVKESNDGYMRTYNVMRLGDIAFEGNKSKNFSHGRFVENTIGDGIVSHVFDVFRPVMNYDLLFWKYLINNENVMGRIMTRCTKASTMMTNLVAKDFLNEDILVPIIEEQTKIGECIDKIDHLITLHQRKCDETKKLKKFMLQKMFPKKDAKKPEIRFAGFTDDWEQRKLSEVAEIVGGGTPSTNIPEYWDGDIDWYAPAEINDQIYVDGSERKITKLGLEKSSAKILPADITVLFTSRAGIGKTAILRRSGATNQGFQSMVLNDETNPYFVFSISKFIKEEAERVASGSTFAEVSGKMLGNLAFMFPTKKEQDKIGEYFSNLDNLITLHQRKCDELKEFKKYMLQNMFPQKG